MAEPLLGERLFHLSADELLDPLDPLDCSLDIQVDGRKLRRPGLEHPINAIGLGCCLCHVRILFQISLDVKLPLPYTLQVK
jgi:hypothetical protein